MSRLESFRRDRWATAPKSRTHAPDMSLGDDRLRLLFACCHPRLKDDEQIALILHDLCGLTAAAIADGLPADRAAVEKRVARGRNMLASAKHPFDLEIDARIPAVQNALHLLFHKGFHSAQIDICGEAIDLVELLLEHPGARIGPTYGLAALMYLNAARLPPSMQFIPIELQDRSKWNLGLIAQGLAYLEQSSRDWELADYQIEAAIAAVHANASSADETDWSTIVTLYDSLFAVRPSAIVALNRAIAIGYQAGAERGLKEILSISDDDILQAYPFYWATLGEFALRSGKKNEAKRSFHKARELARNPFERDHYAARIAACRSAAM